MEHQNVQNRPKKRLKQPENTRRSQAKRQKAQGQGYTQNHSMNIVPPRSQRDENCRHNCRNQFSLDEKMAIFNDFNTLNCHEKQNIYLRGCSGDDKQKSWRIIAFGRTTNVCLGLHGIQYSRLRRKVKQNVAIQDLRGKHGNQKKTSDDILESVRTFIRNLPSRDSHYSLTVNPHRKYLDSNVTIASLYEQLIRDENNMATRQNFSMWQFRKMWNYEFNISVGYPRSDVCETCETYVCNIKHAQQNDDRQRENYWKTKQEAHWNESKQFFNRMSKDREEFKDPTHGFFCFDFQKNLAFPITNVGKEFYLRQLWMHNFTIHDLRSGEAYMFLYCEHFANKGSSETVSFLEYFITQILSPDILHLHLYSDNSFGQNKNRFLLAYFQTLCLQRLMSLEVNFPLPGHSRMLVDADFGIIEKKKKKEDKINFPSQWVEVIRNARKDKPFHIYFVNHPITDDLREDGTPIVLIRDYKSSLTPIINPTDSLNSIRRLKFQRGRFHPFVSRNMTDEPTEEYQITKSHVNAQTLIDVLAVAPLAYENYLPVTREKYDNVQTLLSKFHRPPDKMFYTSIFARPVPQNPIHLIIEEVMAEYEPFDVSFLDEL